MLSFSGPDTIEALDEVTVISVNCLALAGLPLLSCSWRTKIGLLPMEVAKREGGAIYACILEGAGITVVTFTLAGKRDDETAVMPEWP
jgi:hypothetical protein